MIGTLREESQPLGDWARLRWVGGMDLIADLKLIDSEASPVALALGFFEPRR